ncbi:MAG: TetR/AcrR family transcriptional regulator [Sphingomonas sp.]|uniref:TetR/AcrR family transcriptional regulator n=1 Tax=Sphingomonas sp. TaxID=28214 RepID=UPI001B1422FA|nr:TetR/AcrR family transcriptional regulator [Sphingomonas sp.]MBO9624431.1 TetR/AcrR family transcriptional regulator [Sphingomonas sp.]
MSKGRTLTERSEALPALAEVFREHGFEGTSLSLISTATGLGKGSLYNFFPGGKEEMMRAVLADIDAWFDAAIFAPLEQAPDPAAAIAAMMREVEAYFRSGQRVCLVGWLGLGASRDPFGEPVKAYFARWIAALAACLQGGGVAESEATRLAEQAVAGIQGAIVLSRALGDDGAFVRLLRDHETRLTGAVTGRR